MRCPKCQLENPPNAQRCNCGYDFASGELQTAYVHARSAPSAEKSSWFIETVAAILLLLNMLLSGAVGARSARSGAEVLGAIVAPAFIALVVVGIGTLFKAGRTRRSRAKIVLVTMVVVLLGNCGNLAKRERASAGPGARPTQAQLTRPKRVVALSGRRSRK